MDEALQNRWRLKASKPNCLFVDLRTSTGEYDDEQITVNVVACSQILHSLLFLRKCFF